jgi:hypothetical protein
MKQITYVVQFRGRAEPDGDRLVASSCVFVTTAGPEGVSGTRFESGEEIALFESRVMSTGSTSFVESGTICFGDTPHKLQFTTLGQGHLEQSVDPHLKHGSVVFRIEGGKGRFSRASGLITSNFTESDDGEVIDNHFATIFVV